MEKDREERGSAYGGKQAKRKGQGPGRKKTCRDNNFVTNKLELWSRLPPPPPFPPPQFFPPMIEKSSKEGVLAKKQAKKCVKKQGNQGGSKADNLEMQASERAWDEQEAEKDERRTGQ